MVQHTKNERAIPDALRHFDSLPDSASVRLPVVAALVGCSTATVWRMVKRGTLPTPRQRGLRITAWSVGELRKALAVVSPAVMA
ncbi:MAG: AlpA family phage regulatory protein [Candidatus Accumulibacter sp.]|uniref:helix-turn-helix transcriptional regulator n=1 Tax=unclassified Candidatus Accumulibacter TaxID=2619054 RepID=UPI001A5AD0B7|nr:MULTISPECIES: AlpA family phage regulatory protein [unclassified Candidatus Accumulibacter]MBL8366362.1 AlpA family phage regulatory protein [Accumulibacter sp.]